MIAAVHMAADSSRTAGSEREAALNNSGNPLVQVSGREAGLAPGRPATLAPRFAKVGTVCGLCFDWEGQ